MSEPAWSTQASIWLEWDSYAAGNVRTWYDGSMTHTYTYDAEGRILSIDSGSIQYMYDVFGRRVQKNVSGGKDEFVYDLAGKVVARVNGSSGNWIEGPVWAGGRHLATYGNSTTYFSHQDWLGTERVRTDVSGNSVETCTSTPYGDNWSCTGTDWSPYHFAGMYRDWETGFYYTPYRYYNPRLGSWMTPDPAGLAAADPANPQSWNRYAYVANDPVNYFDPLGLKRPPCHQDDDCPPSKDSGGGGGGWWEYLPGSGGGGMCAILGLLCGPDRPPVQPPQDRDDSGGGGGNQTGTPPAATAANNGKQPKCISRSSLPFTTRATLSVLSWAAKRSGGVRGIGVGGSGAFAPPSLAGGGGSVQALWVADYLGQQGLYWSVSGGPTVGEKGFGAVGGFQYMTSTVNRGVIIQDVVNSSLSVGGGAGAGFGLGSG